MLNAAPSWLGWAGRRAAAPYLTERGAWREFERCVGEMVTLSLLQPYSNPKPDLNPNPNPNPDPNPDPDPNPTLNQVLKDANALSREEARCDVCERVHPEVPWRNLELRCTHPACALMLT